MSIPNPFPIGPLGAGDPRFWTGMTGPLNPGGMGAASGGVRATARAALPALEYSGFPSAASYMTPAHEVALNRALNAMLSSSGPSGPRSLTEIMAGPTSAAQPYGIGPLTSSIETRGAINPNIMPRSSIGFGDLLSKPTGWRGYLGRGAGALGWYGGLQGAGAALGTDNGAGYGLSSAAAPAGLTYALTGSNPLTATVGAGVGLGTGIAKLINPENSWGNVGANIQRGLGAYHPNEQLPTTVPLSAIAASFDENGKLSPTLLANVLRQHGVEGAELTEDGKTTLTGDALDMLQTIRENPGQYASLGALTKDLTPEERDTLDSTYSMALLTAEDPNSPEARDQALGIARLAIDDMRNQADQEQRFTEMALAYQTAAQQILAPVTANMDAQAQFSYNNMLSAIPSLPPELQGVAAMQAQAQLQGSQMVSNAYRAQAATMMPALWLGQQQDQFNQLVSQLQPQVMSAGLGALGIGQQAGGGGMTLADIAPSAVG